MTVEKENPSNSERNTTENDTKALDKEDPTEGQLSEPFSAMEASNRSSTTAASLDQTFAKAIWVLRFAIFADAVNSQILGPNYALMVLEGGSPDSFESTAPFGFGGAYYFMPMCGDIGMVVSALFFGYISDKIGRKKCILACMYLGAVGSILKYLARDIFLLFCGANFVTGLFGGSLAVGMAYASDIFPDRQKTDAEIGTLIAVSMIGRTGGGIAAISMQSIGLFAPLWLSAGISLLAGLLCHIWMQDKERSEDSGAGEKDAEAGDNTELFCELGDISEDPADKCTLWNVLLGELADNLGSIGLVPFCISPLMFNTFYVDFVEQDMDPIMSAEAYKWIYVLVAVIVVPGAAAAPFLFKKFGPALSAVGANLLTGMVTIALLQIANATPSTATFAIFVTVLYLAFPMTVISQLSTGPMLDRIAPEDQRGRIQGYNMAMMNLAGAIGPFLLGNLSDATSIDVCLYTTAAISVVAAVINFPLSKDPRLGPTLVPQEEGEEAAIPPAPLSFRVSTSTLYQSSMLLAPASFASAHLSTTASSRAIQTSLRAFPTTSSRALARASSRAQQSPRYSVDSA